MLDRATGRMVNANLEPTRWPVRARFRGSTSRCSKTTRAASATDAYGIAEPANIATAPAIGNAVYNAIGVRVRSLPLTPAAVLEALGKLPARG